MTSMRGILYNQLFVSIPDPKLDFTGQTVIVTGANTGLGLEAARHLVRLNAERVILAVRSVDKGERAKQDIEKSTKREGVVQVWELDLASYESVKNFAKRVNNDLQRLDCVIGNAAINAAAVKVLEDNESSLTVNVVSTFLLTILLLPLCRRTAASFNVQPRITVISSDLHAVVDLPERHQPDIFAALNADKSFSGVLRRYGVTKLLEVLVTRELAARMGSPSPHVQDLIVNCANPGLSASELTRDAPLWIKPVLSVMKHLMGRSAEVGSRAHILAAGGSAETHGQYMDNGVVIKPSKFVRSEDGLKTQRRVFDELLKKLENIEPGISQLVTGK